MYNPTMLWPRHGTKRKSVITPETVPIPPPPEKHFVSEEEMAAELHRLQLGEQALLQSSNFQFTTAQSPFMFNTQGQFSGFGAQPQSFPSCGQIPASCTSAAFAQSPSQSLDDSVFDDDSVEIVEMDSDGSDSTKSEEKSQLPRLSVSEDLLSIKPQPVLPPSLVQKMSASYNMALVPYVPLKFPPLETSTADPIVTEPPDPMEDEPMMD